MTIEQGQPPAKGRRVLCVGAAVLDTIFRVRSLPEGQGKILPYDMVQIAEGMASSAAFAVARLGGAPSLWSAVGGDGAGERVVAELRDAGIDTGGIVTCADARTAVSTILVDDSGERLIVPYYDPKLHETPKAFTEADIAGFDAVLVDVRWPALAHKVLLAARALGKHAVLDGDVAADGVIEMLAPAATHIVFSQPAAERLSGLADIARSVMSLQERYPSAFISVTAGEQGCFWFDRNLDCVLHMPALAVAAIDTLAAGDVFHGAFALAIAEGMAAEEAIRFSSVAAALKCRVFGGRAGAPSRADVEAVLADFPENLTASIIRQ